MEGEGSDIFWLFLRVIALGLILGYIIKPIFLLGLTIGLVVTGLVEIGVRKKIIGYNWKIVLLIILIFLLVAWRVSLSLVDNTKPNWLGFYASKGAITFEVQITRIAQLKYPPTFFGQVKDLKGELAWQTYGKVIGEVGSKVLVTCSDLTPGTQGLVWCAKPKVKLLSQPSWWQNWTSNSLDQIGRGWQKVLPGSAGGFAEALVTGDEHNLGSVTRDNFKRAGLQHVLALSGYNVTVLLVWLGWLLSFCGLKRLWRFGGMAVFLIFYTALTGFSPSLVRAAIFGGLALWTRELGSLIRPWRLVLLTGVMTLLINPLQLWSVSFLLSYGAFFGIVCVSPALEKFVINWPGADLWRWSIPTLAATLGILPIIFLSFGQWSWISLPVNLLLAPLWPLALLLAWLGTIFLPVMPIGLGWLPWKFFFESILGLVALVSRAPSPLWTVPPLGWIAAAIWYAILGLLVVKITTCQGRKVC